MQNQGPVVYKSGMPFELDDGVGHRARIGLIVLASDLTVEYELRKVMNLRGVALYGSRLSCAPTITPETLRNMEREIPRAADLILPGQPLDVVAYGCTSGAVVIGEEKVHARIHEVRPGVTCTTPMEAAFAAFHALNAHRICLITPYSDEITSRMRQHIEAHGFQVPVMGSWNESDDGKVGRISPASIRAALLDLGRSDLVDAVFVSCTSLRVVDIVREVEAELGKAVTSSNHALAWHCLRLAGIEDRHPEFGTLFSRGVKK